MWSILKAFFFHLEQKVRSSEEWLNLRSVMAVVRFITVLNAFGSITYVSGSTWKRFTVPIFDPDASSWPFGLIASFVVLNEPESETFAMHLRIFRSH